MMIMAHGTVGLQHASMAIYNAYCDRVPVYIVLGNILDVNFRRGNAEWAHSVQDAAAMVRDYIKWDDTPVSLEHFAESAVRAYKIAMTPPYEPVVIVADGALQEEPIDRQEPAHPEADDERAAAGRFRRRAGSRQDAGRRRKSGDRRRPRRAHAEGHRAAGRAGRSCCKRRCKDQRMRMNFPSRASACTAIPASAADAATLPMPT